MISIKKTCPVCDSGPITFRKCSDGKTIILFCEECELLWENPEQISSDKILELEDHNGKISGKEIYAFGPKTDWASKDEIINQGWEKFIPPPPPTWGPATG